MVVIPKEIVAFVQLVVVVAAAAAIDRLLESCVVSLLKLPSTRALRRRSVVCRVPHHT